jgi:23S rRNA (adenine2503-C2)-methyltransferase
MSTASSSDSSSSGCSPGSTSARPSPPSDDARADAPTRDARRAIQGLTPPQLAEAAGIGIVTARKLVAAVQQRGMDAIGETVPKQALRAEVDRVAARFRVGRLEIVTREASQVDPFVKYLFRCEDGALVEAVRIPLEKPGRFVACVSSQVGCALGCRYCATGRLGLSRNLEAWEIVEQVRVIRRELPLDGNARARVHGVVFQGMGEPLANVDRVMQAIRVLHDPCGQAIEQRAITVCTAGVPGGIRKLAASELRVRLGVSIASARREVRRSLLPVEDANPLDEVLAATAEYVRAKGDAPMLAVTLLGGINTSDEDADAFGRLALSLRDATGVAPRLSLVPYNPSEGDRYARATDDEMARFHDRISRFGVPVVRRYSGGGDVGAACGQLVGKQQAPPDRPEP